MNYVPKGLTRLGYRQLLKLRKNSPTILVVGGVVGFGVTAVMAAKATRKIDPILEDHAKSRMAIEYNAKTEMEERSEVIRLYTDTSIRLVKLYAPTLVVGTLSTVSVLHGHRILKGRHVATMAAYTGLMDQYNAYRARVAETIGSELERDLHGGAIGKHEEDPDHPGEYKLKAKYGDKQPANYLRPFFDESNPNWNPNASSNLMFLKAVQAHMNVRLRVKGYVFLSEVYQALGIPRVKESIITGWVYDGEGDDYVDLGFMTDQSPEAVMFRNGAERSVRLNFNIDGVIWDKI